MLHSTNTREPTQKAYAIPKPLPLKTLGKFPFGASVSFQNPPNRRRPIPKKKQIHVAEGQK